MPWAIAIREVESQNWILVTSETRIDADDPRYEQDVHVVPCAEDVQDARFLSMGGHDFTRQCCCQPRIEEEVNRRPMVIHNGKVN